MGRIRVIHVVHSLANAGTEGGVRKLLAGLDPGRFEQIVCTVAPAPAVEPESGARVIPLGRPGNVRRVLIRALREVFLRERPDIVHSRNWGAIEAVVAARSAGVRGIIHSEHGLEISSYRRQPWRRRIFRRLCFEWANHVFAVSVGLRDYYAKELLIDKHRIQVIPNGVDTMRFRPCIAARRIVRDKLNIGQETVVIGTVGRLDPIKDHRTLFEAVDLLLATGLPVQLVIVGEGTERRTLERDVQARKLLAQKTVFVGETSEVATYLNGFDVFVLPSHAEGMSNALLEAMAVSLACVATRVGGNPELVEHGSSGLLFEAQDTAMLAAHLKTVVSDARWRSYLGENARRRAVEGFSWSRMLTNYTKLYEEAVSDRQANSGILSYVSPARALHK